MLLRTSYLVIMLSTAFLLGILIGFSYHLPQTSSDDLKYLHSEEPPTKDENNGDNLQKFVDGVYWTEQTQSLVPPGFTPQDFDDWKKSLDYHRVVDVREGCGRMQNRAIQMEDGTRACVRYRINNDQILGDILSFHLSQLLNIYQVPPSVLSLTDPRTTAWGSVSAEVAAAQWHHEKPVILTPWVDNLSPVYIPRELQGPQSGIPRKLHPTHDILANKSETELRDLVQWSDLIIFDYLTANLDRVVNNMFNHQWNADMMISPTHNLESVGDTGLLVFLDNEAGLLHGYRLLDKYQSYHETLLKSLCIFRPQTALRIKELMADKTSLGQVLMDSFAASDSLHHLLPKLPQKNVKILQTRLKHVHDQITDCEALYPGR